MEGYTGKPIDIRSIGSIRTPFKEASGTPIQSVYAQGAEGRILQGAQGLIEANRLKLLLEFWPKGLQNLGTDPLSFLRQLEAWGFEVRLVNETRGCLEPFDFQQLLTTLEGAKVGKEYVSILAEKK